jgi:hypothetical protein
MSYNVYRRKKDDDVWTQVASGLEVRMYDDTDVTENVYEYAVTEVVDDIETVKSNIERVDHS